MGAIDYRRLPRFVWRLMKLPRLAYALGLGPIVGKVVLLLTTTGRKSGLPRVTPLQYEEEQGVVYVGSARGTTADWYRNLLKDRRVEVRMGSRHFEGTAEPITDPARIADFLELRLRRHPRMVGAMLRSEGLPRDPTRTQLEEFARSITAVAIRRHDDRP